MPSHAMLSSIVHSDSTGNLKIQVKESVERATYIEAPIASLCDCRESGKTVSADELDMPTILIVAQ